MNKRPTFNLTSKFDMNKGLAIFKGLNLSIFAGSFYFLTGQSGAGKTSFLKLIYGGLTPTEGVVRVFSRDLTGLSQGELPMFRQRMGLVFQDCRLIDHLTAIDNVALSLRVSGVDSKKALQNASELLDWVGLGAHLYDYPTVLSDGQKQRVAIARAVITRPLLLLADEPTGNVDEESATRLMYLFEELNKIGTTVIVATHNLKLVEHFPYPQMHIENGQINSLQRAQLYAI